MSADYDAIVVGAGAAGTIVAATLAEAGKRVLLIERGSHESYASAGHRDHLRNQRYSAYGHNAGPDIVGNPRVLVQPDSSEAVLAPHENGYSNNAAIVGGGTFVYGGQAWRFLPDDFRMASRYGVPEGSSLVDWPFPYETLAPWYERAEREIGVAGDATGLRQAGEEARGYPMPAVPASVTTARLKAAAQSLGISTVTPPLLINTVPRDGRDACIQCGSCVGFPCPSDAKNGTQNTVLPRALATSAMTLVSRAMVEEITTDGSGKVTGVSYLVDADGRTERRRATARAVVVSAGAVETARLLLMSRSALHPEGLGNANGLVGRNLQGHYYPAAAGLFDEMLYDPHGPGVTIATTAHNHGNDGIIGGGMLADDFVTLPAIFWRHWLPPRLRRWGLEAKRFMRDNYRRVVKVMGPVHEIPTADCRVTLDPVVTDAQGLPVARLSGVVHAETVRTASFMFERATDWIRAAGAREVWGSPPVARLSGGQHQAGTCRMGTDPAGSVTDPFGRVWGHDNLFVSDASLHPTNGGFNPVLTIMALAFRNGDAVTRAL